jgi:hypothetical protein
MRLTLIVDLLAGHLRDLAMGICIRLLLTNMPPGYGPTLDMASAYIDD